MRRVQIRIRAASVTIEPSNRGFVQRPVPLSRSTKRLARNIKAVPIGATRKPVVLVNQALGKFAVTGNSFVQNLI
jgi:hypothetical protein